MARDSALTADGSRPIIRVWQSFRQSEAHSSAQIGSTGWRWGGIGAAVAALALACAPSAFAHSKVCGISVSPVNEHCYALSEWEMTNGEEVEGESIKIDTISNRLPGAPEGDYLTNEVWVGFDGGKHWIESGQIAEEVEGLHWFWAHQNHIAFEKGYPLYPQGPALNTWNTYMMQWVPSRGNSWGVWINGIEYDVGEGLEDYSRDLEAGTEMTDVNITNTAESTEAENLGTQGKWWEGWQASGSGNYAKPAKYGPESPDVPNCVKEINHAWAFFYGAQPCGDNGWEPSVQQPITAPPSTQPLAGESTPKPASAEAEAVAWSAKSGDATPLIVRQASDTYELRGHFVAFGPIPPHAERPTGTVLKLTIEPTTNRVVKEVLE
jgi:hypothetical protein